MPERFIAGQYLETDRIDAVISTQTASKWQGLRSLKNKIVVAKVGYGFENAFDVPIHYSKSVVSLEKTCSAASLLPAMFQ